MSNPFQERNPFDILVRNFLQKTHNYQTLEESKLPHPVDIYEVENGLGLDIACTGIPKENIEILIEGNIIKINYNKPTSEQEEIDYIHKGIAKRSFNLGWKIDSRFDLQKAKAEFINGLLQVTIPYAKGKESKTLKIS
jgi:HSP20 family molecular chaperone IbpA|tara:strand:+ start:1796 stop:2209 length:414 start_codon:yes stop_codon:yes gene_type:complete